MADMNIDHVPFGACVLPESTACTMSTESAVFYRSAESQLGLLHVCCRAVFQSFCSDSQEQASPWTTGEECVEIILDSLSCVSCAWQVTQRALLRAVCSAQQLGQ